MPWPDDEEPDVIASASDPVRRVELDPMHITAEDDDLDRLISRVPIAQPREEPGFFEGLATEIPDLLRSAAEQSGLTAAGARIGSALMAPFVGADEAERRRAEAMERAHAAAQAAEVRSPGASLTGGALGMIAPMLAEGPRSALGMLSEAAGYGAITSEAPDLAGVVDDAGTATMTAAPLVAAGHIPGMVRRRILSPEAQAVRDQQRYASAGGARGLGASDARRGASLPGGIAGQAERMREMGLPHFFDTPADIAQRARGQAESAYTESGDIRQQFVDSGESVPLEDILTALEGVAAESARSPERRLMGLPETVRTRAREYRRGMGSPPRQTLAAQSAEEELMRLLQQRAEMGPPQSVLDLIADIPRITSGSTGATLPTSAATEALGATRQLPPQTGPIDSPIGLARTMPGGPTGISSQSAERVGEFPRLLGTEEATPIQHAMRDDIASGIDDAYARARGPRAVGVPLPDLEREISLLGQQTQYTTPAGARMPAGDETMAQQYTALRDVADDAVARTLPGGDATAERFRQSRLRTQTATDARLRAEAAMARQAGHSIVGGLGSTAATAAGAAMGGPAGGAAARVGHGVIAPRLPAMRTVSADTVAALLRSPRTEALGRILQRAMHAGRLGVVHEVLSRSDPEYAATIEAASQPDQAGEAPTAAPTERSSRARAARRELARRELERRGLQP